MRKAKPTNKIRIQSALLTVCALLLSVLPVQAQVVSTVPLEQTFKASIIEVLQEQNATTSDNEAVKQQNLKLKGLEGDFKDKEFVINSIGNPEAQTKNVFRRGDKVLVTASLDDLDRPSFVITDYVRTDALLWLFGIFAASLLTVGRWKGLRSLLSLALTFVVMIRYIVPQILDGADPVAVTIIGCLIVLLLIIYLTEGFRSEAHIGAVSIFLSLIITVGLSWVFVSFAKLSGTSNEEASFIVNLGVGRINLQGILLAGIIVGALGVLDDVAISQVSAVSELNQANSGLTRVELYKKAMNVGVAHISSMTNTLFLAYAGASLPLLILFASGQSAFAGWDIAINNELLATEIVRTLAGSVGLILAVPITTLVAVAWVKGKRK